MIEQNYFTIVDSTDYFCGNLWWKNNKPQSSQIKHKLKNRI